MQITIQARPFELTDALRQAVHDQAEKHLARHADSIRRLDVRLDDLNGPRGGPDMVCRIHSDLGRASPLVAEAVSVDLYAAINEAFAKAARGVGGRVKRRRGQLGRQARSTIRGQAASAEVAPEALA